MSDIKNNDDFLDSDDDLFDDDLEDIDLDLDLDLDESLDDDTQFDAMDSNMDGEIDEEDWDSFDDDTEAPVPADSKKSFVSRHFNVILIAVFVVGGGLFLYNTVLAPAQKPQPVPQNNTPDTASAASATNEEAPRTGLGIDLQNLRSSDERTPIVPPYAEDVKAVDNDIALGENLTQEKTIVDYAATPISDEDDFFSNVNLAQKPDIDDEEEVSETFTPSAPPSKLTPMPQIIAPQHSDPEPASAPVRIARKPVEVKEPVQIAVTQAPKEVVEVPAIIKPAVNDINVAAVEALEKNVSTLTSELESLTGENTDLKDRLSASSNETEALGTMVDDLKATIARLEKEASMAAKASVAAKAAPKAPVKSAEQQSPIAPTITAPAKATPIKAAAKTPTPARTTKVTPVWVMRSAQEGKAVLADKNTGNSIRVEVGEAVSGLGVIQSITLDNGSWIVKGARGSVKR